MTNDYFFDTDCLSAFLWINDTNILKELYGGKIVFPSPVYDELSNPAIPHLKQRADVLIDDQCATIKQLDYGTDEYKLYKTLVEGKGAEKAIGKGEAAGIALAKTYNGTLASNNYKDISPYIDKYKLKHIDTGMILEEALEKGLITEADGNSIWQRMLNKNRMLPTATFTEYLKSKGQDYKETPYK